MSDQNEEAKKNELHKKMKFVHAWMAAQKKELKELPFVTDCNYMTASPGEYVIADPCYVVSDEYWMTHIMLIPDKVIEKGCTVSFEGVEFLLSSTVYGDNFYDVEGADGFAVDSGLFAIMPRAMVGDKYNPDLMATLKLEDQVIFIGKGCLKVSHEEIVDTDWLPTDE